MLLETLELLLGPRYQRTKLKPLEAWIAGKCTLEDLPKGPLARHTGLKTLQLHERAERRMASELPVQFQSAGLFQQPRAGRLDRRGVDAERIHHGPKCLPVLDDLLVQDVEEVAELRTSILCSSTARKLYAERRAGKVVVQVDVEPAHREHYFLLPGAATRNPQRSRCPPGTNPSVDGGDDADEARG
jgi:hypothetical protein